MQRRWLRTSNGSCSFQDAMLSSTMRVTCVQLANFGGMAGCGGDISSLYCLIGTLKQRYRGRAALLEGAGRVSQPSCTDGSRNWVRMSSTPLGLDVQAEAFGIL